MPQPKDKRYRVFDGDSHLIEPAAVWETYLDPAYRQSARSAFWHDEGPVTPVTVLNGRMAAELYQPHASPVVATRQVYPPHETAHVNIPRHGVWHPGMTADDVAALDPDRRHPLNPGGSDPEARLRDMDAMGIDQALLFPTYFAEYFPLVENPDVARALARAYNDWAHELGQADPGRLFPAAVIPMQDINFAVAEAERAAGLGFKAAFIRPHYVQDQLPHHPYYYPLWRALEEAGMLFCSHPSWGINAREMDANAPFVERIAAYNGIGHAVAEVVAPVMDNGVFLIALMFEGLLEKFPNIKLYLAHSKATWLPLYLEKTEGYLWLSRQQQPVSLEPEQVFRSRSTLIAFDGGESSIWELYDAFEDVAAWGSLYPNHDTRTATETIAELEHHRVPEAAIEKLMGGNTARVLGVSDDIQ